MNSAAYAHSVQSLLDYARLEMRIAANNCQFNDRANGQIDALMWLDAIDPADYTAFINEKFFLYSRACARRRAAEKGASA